MTHFFYPTSVIGSVVFLWIGRDLSIPLGRLLDPYRCNLRKFWWIFSREKPDSFLQEKNEDNCAHHRRSGRGGDHRLEVRDGGDGGGRRGFLRRGGASLRRQLLFMRLGLVIYKNFEIGQIAMSCQVREHRKLGWIEMPLGTLTDFSYRLNELSSNSVTKFCVK